MTRLALLAVLLVILTTACGAPAPGGDGGTGGVADSWVRAGESACRGVVTVDPVMCGTGVEPARASRIGVWVGGGTDGIPAQVIPVEKALSSEMGALLVIGLDTAAIQRCDFSRFPHSPVCTVSNTCTGYNSIRFAGFVSAVAREFIRTGRCW